MNTVSANRFDYSELRIINNRKRRERELKRRIILFCLSVVLFAIILGLFFSTKSMASTGEDVTLYKYYKSVQINSGDTLTSIALDNITSGYKNYDSLKNEIMFINNLDDSSLLITGNYLIIPYYDTFRG